MRARGICPSCDREFSLRSGAHRDGVFMMVLRAHRHEAYKNRRCPGSGRPPIDEDEPT